MNVVREIGRINQRELALNATDKASWHADYAHSPWVFVGGMPYEMNEGDVVTVLSQFGEVDEVNMVRNKETGKSNGYAFVKYEDQRSTVLAVDNLTGSKILGRTLRCDHVKDYKKPKKREDDSGEDDKDELTDKLVEENLSFFTKEMIAKLESDGYIVCDGFAGAETLSLVHGEAMHQIEEKRLKEAGMSRGDNKWTDKSIRSDSIMWINKEAEERMPHTTRYLTRIEELRQELNNAVAYNSERSQTQLAVYPQGGRYIKHRDSFVGGNSRRLTLIYYLNGGWQTSDGGALRIHHPSLDTPHTDIEPLGDRLLIFLAEHIDHEVLVSNASSRAAITTWFY
eukprot:gene15087-17861_t